MRDEPRPVGTHPIYVLLAAGAIPSVVFSPDTFTRREARFRRHKWLNYLRCCRAANRSATVAFPAFPAAAAIAAAMFGSSSAVFAPLNALAFMSRAAARSRVACAVRVIASRATLIQLPLPLLRPATARPVVPPAWHGPCRSVHGSAWPSRRSGQLP